MYFADRNEHAVPLFIDANIFSLNSLYCKSVCNNSIAPINLSNLFTKTSMIHSYTVVSSTSETFANWNMISGSC
jgi:hypothetical protein